MLFSVHFLILRKTSTHTGKKSSLHKLFDSVEAMEETDMRDYVNEQPRKRENLNRMAHHAVRRVGQLLLLSFALLCIIQATLNLSLRLTLRSSKESAQTECNTTHVSGNDHKKEVSIDRNQETPDHCNTLQERFNALTRDKNTLENRNNILNNKIKLLEEERDRLKLKLGDGCISTQLCPSGWKEINSKCYYLSSGTKTWKESRQDCQNKGGDLVVINSGQEQDALYHLDGDQSLMFWIGLYKIGTAFKWVDGSEPTRTFWSPDRFGSTNSEYCVVMNRSNPVLNSWSTDSCELRHLWLCEKDPGLLP